jgi:hypothetical protein
MVRRRSALAADPPSKAPFKDGNTHNTAEIAIRSTFSANAL